MLGRLAHSAVRTAGLTIALTAVLNFTLSLLSAKMGSVLGIVGATFLAQSISSAVMNSQTCRLLALPYAKTFVRTWLAPVIATAMATAIRYWIPLSSMSSVAGAIGLNLILLLVVVWALGLRREVIEFELGKFRGLFGKS
jgi:hypothetical protein